MQDDAHIFCEKDKITEETEIFCKMLLEVYKDFIDEGMIENEKGETILVYPRAWEARVYASAENVWAFMNKSSVPITIIRAENSNVISDETWDKVKKRVKNANFIEMKDVGHLIPFEKPKESAELIKPLITID